MNVTLKAPSTVAPGSQVILPDGTSTTVDADGLIEVSVAFTATLMNAGYELTGTSIGETADAEPDSVMGRDSDADTEVRDLFVILAGGLSVINKSGSDIVAGKLVALSGLDATSGLPKIVVADADVAALDDVYAVTVAIANNAEGRVYKGALSAADLNTNSASSAGDPVYLSTTAGGFTHTAPSTLVSRVQPVGFVVVKSATVGQIFWHIGPVRTISRNELQQKIVCGEGAFDGSNPTSVAHGLTTCTAVTFGLKGSAAPGVGTSTITAVINGANVDFYAWKPTATGDCTLIASTGTEGFYWIAAGV